MAERTTSDELPRWFPLLFAGVALLNLLEHDWLGTAIFSVAGLGFMLPSWQTSPAWAKMARVVLGAALLVLLVPLVNKLRADF
jgi:hypothetical protein